MQWRTATRSRRGNLINPSKAPSLSIYVGFGCVTSDIAEIFLGAARSEFRDPVILFTFLISTVFSFRARV